MKKIILTVILIGLSQIFFGQEFQQDFLKHWKSNDSTALKELLVSWEKTNPDDPELYSSYFNFYFNKSNQIKNDYTRSKTLIDNAFEYINKGIEKYPNRLDMRFGKIHVLSLQMNWDEFTNEIIDAIEYSNKIEYNWIWANNQPKENSKTFFLNSIQKYIVKLYGTGNDSLLVNMRNISNKILEFDPNHIQSLSNISTTYLVTKQYDKAINILLNAEKINPNDYVIVSNIALGYKLKGDKQKAIEYYKKIIEYGDDKSKESAQKEIDLLKKTE